MIRCNLSVLLAERNLKITKVAKDTKISRTTLSSIAFNYGKGIQFDTLNTLCNYLKVTPNDIITYIPIDIEIISFEHDKQILNIKIKTASENKAHNFSLCCSYEVDLEDDKVNSIDICVDLRNANENEEIEKENTLLSQFLAYLPISFLNELSIEISDFISEKIKNRNPSLISNSCSFNIDWGVNLSERINYIQLNNFNTNK